MAHRARRGLRDRDLPGTAKIGSVTGPIVPALAGRARRALQVLAGVRRGVDSPGALGLLAGDQRADVHDPLALLAGDARPVVGVGGVRQVLVLLELVDTCLEQVADAQALLRLVGPGV